MIKENVYTSVACNRTPECADWGNNGLIVFGACCATSILDSKYNGCSAKILHTYVRHKKRVNTVRWLRSDTNAKETYFMSGADDGLAIVWNIDDFEKPVCYILKGHESGVNAVDGVFKSDGAWVLATAAADSTLKLWNFTTETESAECFQTIHLSSGFCLALRLTILPKSSQVFLAYSGDDESVSLWAQAASENTDFQHLHKLVGHEDWVRGLDFVNQGNDLLLASSGQDNFIRLWRIAPRTSSQVQENIIDIFNAWDETKDDIRVEEKIIQTAENAWYAISLESVLYGHDGWVYGVHWHKSTSGDLQLLSASIDKTLIIWSPIEDGVWLEKIRVGEVGGNSLGFFGGKFASNGKSIMGHSYQGGFHIWNQDIGEADLWTPNVIVGGHFDEVRDLAWEPQGLYVMSVSADQTTRIHAPWIHRANEMEYTTWHELARPQVHGYDMQALAILSRYKFASGAEEKIIRTFQSPANFIENFRRLAQVENDVEGDTLLKSLPKGASVPSLGLSNKAVYNVELEVPVADKHIKDEYPENYFMPITLNTPPQEEALMQNTLWPEVQKLYGHGYEIFALAATPNGQILASSCRATNAEHAQIILWNTTTWKQIQKLSSHQLTVTQMRFSPNGRYLLSVSRDRRWSLFERHSETDANPCFELLASTDKTNGVHARIIWACDWSHDSNLFVTTSRDGKAVIWQRNETISALKGWHALSTLELKGESITAVAMATKLLNESGYIIAFGFESGAIQIYKFEEQWTLLLALDNDHAHHLTVKRLHFRPTTTSARNEFHLASCGDDHLVRIYKLIL